MDERAVISAWRMLFRGQGATHESLAAAEVLLNGLSGESPLHIRLANELEELKHGPPVRRRKRVTGPKLN